MITKPFTADEWARVRVYMSTKTEQEARRDEAVLRISIGRVARRQWKATKHKVSLEVFEEALKFCKKGN